MDRSHSIVYHKDSKYQSNGFLKHTHAFMKIQGALLQCCFHFKPVWPQLDVGVPAVPSLPCHSQNLGSPHRHRCERLCREHWAGNDAQNLHFYECGGNSQLSQRWQTLKVLFRCRTSERHIHT